MLLSWLFFCSVFTIKVLHVQGFNYIVSFNNIMLNIQIDYFVLKCSDFPTKQYVYVKHMRAYVKHYAYFLLLYYFIIIT